MLVPPSKNGLDSLFREVRVSRFGPISWSGVFFCPVEGHVVLNACLNRNLLECFDQFLSYPNSSGDLRGAGGHLNLKFSVRGLCCVP